MYMYQKRSAHSGLRENAPRTPKTNIYVNIIKQINRVYQLYAMHFAVCYKAIDVEKTLSREFSRTQIYS